MKRSYNIAFTKAVASGNDFIIFDNKNGEMDAREFNWPDLARSLCRRKYSIGADGLLVLEASERASYKMRIFNPDGSEADMCGNGLRCSALYAAMWGWGEELTIETGAGILEAHLRGNNIRLKMSDPRDIKLGINVGIGPKVIISHYINTGVPHVIHIVEGLENYPVKDVGRKLREHALFAPRGTNVDFISDIGQNSAKVRTYERGVEDETLACGTGVVASALVLGLLGHVTSPVNIETRSGEILTVHYNISGSKLTDVYLEGTAELVYEGRI